MKRFFGMMPSSEIEIEKGFKCSGGLNIRIQAGIHGWTIIYADGGTKYADINAITAQENFDEALKIATQEFGTLIPLNDANKQYQRSICEE